ncbi:16S rRNA (guanine(966)-N(2))-methyltransferase RsmD [Candidatus Xianfuyuplasma coldseepsis]|uniref:16S rRNA (Guanine(966)-N(2))-methyltransferase RsmD n=1 Tax=Candidatus Xianfuyuplasma coldseepsis TaxID=2782163 RepID=A0A7L7KU02_9MOLU|nr:16S rRNA (guanine(966)-N(2))-methyltransferase RsmD [Xianfuyuplasma coldseepsis]QMS85726.1 16S rRNA (guanine(966)-N(2))-methyltransferase RsmD [Xianfuyuplasma coldseepsis]
MRIISGRYRHRLIKEVPSDATRETKDRVKESIFNSLHNQLTQATVLDLFAGSGSLGLEALSRGAGHIDFVDQSELARQTINTNSKMLDVFDNVTIHKMDAMTFLQSTTTIYDVILLDPPYDVNIIDDIIAFIATHKRLSSQGTIVALYGKKTSLNVGEYGIIDVKKKTIGITNVSFMKWSDAA